MIFICVKIICGFLNYNKQNKNHKINHFSSKTTLMTFAIEIRHRLKLNRCKLDMPEVYGMSLSIFGDLEVGTIS